MCKWFWNIFNTDIPEIDFHVTFFTKHGGWTSLTFDNGKYYYGEISVPDSFDGGKEYYIRWFDVSPNNTALVEDFIYKEFEK